MADRAPETRSDWALRRLRTAILTGEFPPGTKLRAEDLAERWQVSPTPLREAFQRLGGARLVEVSPQRGVRVAEFTLEDAADLYALRLRLPPPPRAPPRCACGSRPPRCAGRCPAATTRPAGRSPTHSTGSTRRARSRKAPRRISRSKRRPPRAVRRRGRSGAS